MSPDKPIEPARRRSGRIPRAVAIGALATVIGGLLVPAETRLPVVGATPADWNRESFWYRPWGTSGVHKGIDIFADYGTPVVSADSGIVIFAGQLALGGKVVAALGPRWRVHYYAHLSRIDVTAGDRLRPGTAIGRVGTTGNAAGKPPHLHYTIATLVPCPWRLRLSRYGLLRPFYLNPSRLLAEKRRDTVRTASAARNGS